MSQSGEGSPPDETGTHTMKEVSPSVDSVVNAPSSISESLLWPNTDIPKGPERPEDSSEKVTESHQASYDQLSIFYMDPQGEVQGPFTGADIIGWFEGGFFNVDLPVCLVDAAKDTPFLPLGTVMPHLKPNARAPPGFDALKQADKTGDMFVTQGEVDSVSLNFDAQPSFDDRQERGFGEILPDPSPLVKLDILGSGNTSEAAFENQHQLDLKGMPAIDREGKNSESFLFTLFAWSFMYRTCSSFSSGPSREVCFDKLDIFGYLLLVMSL